MSEINFNAATTGDDPELDTLLLRLHTESACRTGGPELRTSRHCGRTAGQLFTERKAHLQATRAPLGTVPAGAHAGTDLVDQAASR
jgi:hypothetical protein